MNYLFDFVIYFLGIYFICMTIEGAIQIFQTIKQMKEIEDE